MFEVARFCDTGSRFLDHLLFSETRFFFSGKDNVVVSQVGEEVRTGGVNVESSSEILGL